MVTHKLHTILVFCFLLTVQVYAETTSSIEIDGKFVIKSPYGTEEVFTDAKFDLSRPARGKRGADGEGVLFIGKLTLRETNGKATVIGVNATFNAEPADPEENLESNRLKRDAHGQTKLWLYGQFALNQAGPSAEVIRVRLNLNTSQITSRRVPYTGSGVDQKTEFGFRGTFTASNGHSNDVRDFSAHLGFRPKITPNRVKRQEIKTTLSLNGVLTAEETLPSTGVVNVASFNVNGDATIEPKLASHGHSSPYDQFLADESNPYQNYFEADGNLTVKAGGNTMFEVPLNASLLGGEHRTKRGAEEDNEVVEVEYHGIIGTTQARRKARVSATAKFWLISKV